MFHKMVGCGFKRTNIEIIKKKPIEIIIENKEIIEFQKIELNICALLVAPSEQKIYKLQSNNKLN